MTWKRNWFTGKYSDGAKSFVAKPEGNEGMIHYEDPTGKYVIYYFNADGKRYFVSLNANYVKKVEGAERVDVAEKKKAELLAELTRAYHDVWGLETHIFGMDIASKNGDI